MALRDDPPRPDLLPGTSRPGPVHARGPVYRNGGDRLPDSPPRPRITLADYAYRKLRYRIVGNAEPAGADRLLGLIQEAVDQRWTTYEETATRAPERFRADAGRDS